MNFAEQKKKIQAALDNGEFSLACTLMEDCIKGEDLATSERLWLLDNLGFARFRMQDPAGALECCKAALELAPEHAYAFKGQGVCLAALGDVAAGIHSLLNAISLDPNFFDATHDLAVILLQNGQRDQAKPWAQRAYQLDPVRGEKLVRNFYPEKNATPQ